MLKCIPTCGRWGKLNVGAGCGKMDGYVLCVCKRRDLTNLIKTFFENVFRNGEDNLI